MTELEAKDEIRTVLARYCRALDRMDKDAACSVWHADGTANYLGIFEGSGRDFVDWVWEAHAAMDRHSHQIAQSLVEVDGDRARSETYVTVVLWPKAEPEVEICARGRYLDGWSLREGRWAIDHRVHVVDVAAHRARHEIDAVLDDDAVGLARHARPSLSFGSRRAAIW